MIRKKKKKKKFSSIGISLPATFVDQVGLPVPSIFFLATEEVHHLSSLTFQLLPQCPKAPSDGPQASPLNFIAANTNYQNWVIIGVLYLARDLPCNVPDLGPREAADFHVSGVHLAYWALCSLQKGVLYDNYPSFVLDRGSVEV